MKLLFCLISFLSLSFSSYSQVLLEVEGLIQDQDTILGGDDNATNEIQILSVSMTRDTLHLSNGGFVIIPGISQANHIKDGDGNSYSNIKIGDQIWLKENLKTTKYNDGTPIPNVIGNIEWASLSSPAYCWYDNDITYKTDYGALYNWWVIDSSSNGNKNACPIGYKVPSEQDFIDLATFLGGLPIACQKMKEAGTLHWLAGNTGNNSSGFCAVGTGERNFDGPFDLLLDSNVIWYTHPTTVRYAILPFEFNELFFTDASIESGASIRCIKE